MGKWVLLVRQRGCDKKKKGQDKMRDDRVTTTKSLKGMGVNQSLMRCSREP